MSTFLQSLLVHPGSTRNPDMGQEGHFEDVASVRRLDSSRLGFSLARIAYGTSHLSRHGQTWLVLESMDREARLTSMAVAPA